MFAVRRLRGCIWVRPGAETSNGQSVQIMIYNKWKSLLWRLRICRKLAAPSRRIRSLWEACIIAGTVTVSMHRQNSFTLQTLHSFATLCIYLKIMTWYKLADFFYPIKKNSYELKLSKRAACLLTAEKLRPLEHGCSSNILATSWRRKNPACPWDMEWLMTSTSRRKVT